MKNKPIVPWQGGKSRLAKHLLPKFPEHSCYVELFCGGGALFFLRDEPAKCEVINDFNGDLVNLYRVVQHHLEEFVRQFKWCLSSRQIFKWLQDTRPETLTDIQRAARFFYLQHHAFGGKVSGQAFGTSTTARSINLLRIEEQLSMAHLRLNGVFVENLSWENCFDRYDREHTFFYMDPPYWELAGYGIDFPFSHYELMAEKMRTCKGKVMVSINDHADIRNVFKDFRIERTELNYTIGGTTKSKNKAGELIIMNY